MSPGKTSVARGRTVSVGSPQLEQTSKTPILPKVLGNPLSGWQGLRGLASLKCPSWPDPTQGTVPRKREVEQEEDTKHTWPIHSEIAALIGLSAKRKRSLHDERISSQSGCTAGGQTIMSAWKKSIPSMRRRRRRAAADARLSPGGLVSHSDILTFCLTTLVLGAICYSTVSLLAISIGSIT